MISHALIAGLIFAESSNMPRPADNGDAVGILQIRPAVIIDVNYHYKRSFTLSDRRSRSKSIAICKLYLLMYCGDDASDFQYAMTWRFGPQGIRSPRAEVDLVTAYWRRVEPFLTLSQHEKQTSNTRGALRRFLTRVASIFGLRRTPVYATHFTQNQHAEPHPTHSYD